jgi:MFS superfamily sulfate permease-like transporter
LLGKVPGRPEFADINENRDIITIPGLLILRPEEGVFYANAKAIREGISDRINNSPTPVQALVVDMEMTSDLDLSAAHMLGDLKKDLDERGIILRLSRLQNSARGLLERANLLDEIGKQNIHPRTLFAVAAYLSEEGVHGRMAYDILPDLVKCVAELAMTRAQKSEGSEREALQRIGEQLQEILEELEELDAAGEPSFTEK